jgi:exodeoxyribonuclease VII small subunit
VVNEGAAAPVEQLGDLDYEAAREALAEVVAKLEAGNLPLEESLHLWERGEALAKVCRGRLDGVRARLDVVLGATVKPDEQ